VIEGKGNLREVVIEATVIRKDGSREELGQISYWNRSPLRRALHNLKEALPWRRS
jgi:hypothetical protein